jgi:chromosome segregation ATPase
MSEDRMQRIEALLETLARNVESLSNEMATKQELATLRSEMATKQELATLRSEMATKQELATLRSEMATKQDLASVAKNVDVTALGRQMRDLLAMKDDVTVLTAIVQRLDNTMARQISDLLTEVRAEHSRMDRLLSRVRALEEAPPPAGG